MFVDHIMVEQELYSSASSFYLIGNIPAALRSADLRSFFSRLVEGGVFLCFHYKHRPEHSRNEVVSTQTHLACESGSFETPTKCCVAVLKAGVEEETDFIKAYSNKNWLDSNGDTLLCKTRIQLLTITDNKDTPTSGSAIPWDELRPLPELNPPAVMPRGNVGTPLKMFMDLIRSCKLPGHVIKKLRLEFPKSRTTRRYGAVKMDYGYHSNWTGSGETSVERDRLERGEDDEGSHDEDDIPSVSTHTHTMYQWPFGWFN